MFVVIGVEGGKGHKGVRRLRCAPALGIAEALHRVLLLAGARITRCPALARRPLQPQTQTSLARSGWCCLALRCAPVKMPNSAAGAAPCVMTHALHHDTAGNPIYPVDIYSDMPASMCRVWVITKRSITASLPRWILAYLTTRPSCGVRRISLAVAVASSAAQLLKSALSTLLSLLHPRPRLRHISSPHKTMPARTAHNSSATYRQPCGG